MGSLPSIKSREDGFYYAHPQNKFWKVLSSIFKEDIPASIEDKKIFLNKHHIALWDVIKSCTIIGSSDSSIRNVTANDISSIIKKSKITKIYTTGKKAYHLYNKYLFKEIGIEAVYLPSTSPANASISYEKLIKIYKTHLISKWVFFIVISTAPFYLYFNSISYAHL